MHLRYSIILDVSYLFHYMHYIQFHFVPSGAAISLVGDVQVQEGVSAASNVCISLNTAASSVGCILTVTAGTVQDTAGILTYTYNYIHYIYIHVY